MPDSNYLRRAKWLRKLLNIEVSFHELVRQEGVAETKGEVFPQRQ